MIQTASIQPGQWAKMLLMAGLREVPYVGKAVKILDRVQDQRKLLLMESAISDMNGRLTRAELRFRGAVRATIAEVIEELRTPELSGARLQRTVREIRELQANRYTPVFFDGLLRNSRHYRDLKRTPENYGTLVASDGDVAPGRFPIFVDFEDSGETRVLEVSPIALQALLSAPSKRGPTADFLANPNALVDVWASRHSRAADAARLSYNSPIDVLPAIKGYICSPVTGERLGIVTETATTSIGRDDSNHLIIEADSVSSRHAIVGWDAEQTSFWIEDVGSTNGVWYGPDQRLLPHTRHYLVEGRIFYIADKHAPLVVKKHETE